MPHYASHLGEVDGKPAVFWDAPRHPFVFAHEADLMTERKHLTHAECAAEYWRARAENFEQWHPWFDGEHRDLAELREVADTLHRFATHPHAREKDYQ